MIRNKVQDSLVFVPVSANLPVHYNTAVHFLIYPPPPPPPILIIHGIEASLCCSTNLADIVCNKEFQDHLNTNRNYRSQIMSSGRQVHLNSFMHMLKSKNVIVEHCTRFTDLQQAHQGNQKQKIEIFFSSLFDRVL